MQLNELIQGLEAGLHYAEGGMEQQIGGLSIDSRAIQPGWLYAALPGTRVDGHDFIGQALQNGATAILCSKAPEVETNATIITVPHVPTALGTICGNFYDHPDQKMKLVGTTGTNGKTTVSTLLYTLFSQMGKKCGLLSTVEYRIGKEVFQSTHTTPDIISLYRLLAKMAAEGCSYCFMEVSSHAIDQDRIAGLEFAGGIFTNITHDHLDYHKTFENYLKAKKKFFDNLSDTAFALTNRDDRNGMVMLQNTKAVRYTYALHNTADFTGRVLESDFSGTLVQINGEELWVTLVGEFNAYNLAAVYGAAFILTHGAEELGVLLSALPRVNGRFEAIQGPNRITAIVDYAHTPDALENVLVTINNIRKNSVRLITIVGCGGNRDAEKRPEMGKIAARFSDRIILTSDNPRDEDPELILDQMMGGVEGQHFKKVLRISDRKEAIKAAVMMAEAGDVILIAGKGHETYQEIKGVKHPFDDKQIVNETFNHIS